MLSFDPAWTATFQNVFHDLLLWVGFGTLAGLTAKAIMPGRDPGGALGTLLMGIVGTIIGCGTLSFFGSIHITPISLPGFAAGTAGAFVILGFYRLFAASVFTSMQSGVLMQVRTRRRAQPRNFL